MKTQNKPTTAWGDVKSATALKETIDQFWINQARLSDERIEFCCPNNAAVFKERARQLRDEVANMSEEEIDAKYEPNTARGLRELKAVGENLEGM